MSDAENDAAYAAGENAIRESYGADAQALPPAVWQAIMAAIQSILASCANPTPANIKAQIQRPLVRLRLYREQLANGVPLKVAGRAQDAVVAAVGAAQDTVLTNFVAAVQSVA